MHSRRLLRLDPGEARKLIVSLQRGALRLTQLIDNLLESVRIEAGRLRVTPRQLDPRTLVNGALEAMRPLAELAAVALHASYDVDLPEVNADPERITQVLSNVVGNALKFTPAGGRVDVHVSRGGLGLVIRVTDTGEGIPGALLPHVFDRFFQVSGDGRTGRRQGAGLGLPIARGIVEAHGGAIRMASEPGAGSTITIELPA